MLRPREEKKMDKPQAQGPLTCYFFVRKFSWDRGGGHSQSMVLLGILKEGKESRKQGKTEKS